MLTERKAARLAGRVARRGRRGERAERRLRDAIVAGDLAAARALAAAGHRLDDLWGGLIPLFAPAEYGGLRIWVDRERHHPFTVMVCDPDPRRLTDPMRDGLVAAMMTDHPVAEIARAKILAHLTDDLVDELCRTAAYHAGVAAFCREHRLVPADPVRQVRYLLLTGQRDAYRTVDPGGELLARAYAVATDDEKSWLRGQALRLGDLDAVRVLVDRNRAEEIARLDDFDVLTLGHALAGQGDWPALWRLMTDASVVAAASLLPSLDPDWSPATGPERRLLDALRPVVESEVTAARDEPTLLHRVDVGETVLAMSVSPDGSQVAVSCSLHSGSALPAGIDVAVFDLRTGERRDDRPSGDVVPGMLVAHCGDAGIVWGTGGSLLRSMTERVEVLTDERVLALASAAGNFAAWTPEGVLLGVAERTDLVHTPSSSVGLGDVGAHGTHLSAAASADGSRFAFAADDRFVVLDAAGRVLTRSAPCDRITDLTFLAPTELVTSHRRYDRPACRWDVGSPAPVRRAAARTTGSIENVVGLPGPRRVVTRGEHGGMFRLDVLGGETLQGLRDELKELGWQPARAIARAGDSAFAVAASGKRHASYADVVEVHDLRRLRLRRLLERPVVTMRPADLEVAATLAASFDDPAVRVVHAALAARLGREVSLGTPVTPSRPDDIVLAEEP